MKIQVLPRDSKWIYETKSITKHPLRKGALQKISVLLLYNVDQQLEMEILMLNLEIYP